MVNNTVYQFVGSNLGVEIFLKKREHQKKGVLKYKIEASLYTLYLLRFPFTHSHLCFSKDIICKMVQSF